MSTNDPLKLSITLKPKAKDDLYYIQKWISESVGGERITRTLVISRALRIFRELLENNYTINLVDDDSNKKVISTFL